MTRFINMCVNRRIAMSRTLFYTLAVLYSLVLPGETRHPYPEGPTAHVVCADLRDNDLDTDRDSADTGCAAAAAFSDVGDGYAAKGEDFILSGGWSVVVDASADGGSYITNTVGFPTFSGQVAGGGLPAETSSIFVLANISTDDAAYIWVKTGTTPHLTPPSNSNGFKLNNGLANSGWQWYQIGSFVTSQAGPLSQWVNNEPQTDFIVAADDAVYIMAPPGLRISCVYVKPIASAEAAQCPGGGSEPEVPTLADFTAEELGANVENADGVAESYWEEANAIAMVGTDTGLTATSPLVRMAWDDTANRLLIIGSMTKAGLISNATADDQSSIIAGTHLELGFRLVDELRVRDADTYKIACDINGFVYDRNDSGGTSNPTFDLDNVICGVSYTANDLVIEIAFDLPSTVTAGDVFLFDGALMELVSGSSAVSKTFFSTSGSNIDPAQWGVGEFSATIMESPPDSTAPTVNTLAFVNVSAGGFTMTFATNEGGLCSRGIDTVNDNAVSDTLLTSCGSSSGGSCSCEVTGLTAGTAYEGKGCVTDPSGNRGCTAVGDQTTSAAGTTRYISPTGDDAGAGTTGDPWRTFTKGYAKANLPAGGTLILKDGTYTHALTGLPRINCAASGGNANNGTSALKITVKAENERQAFINWSSAGAGAGFYPFEMLNCQHWIVEGLRIEGADFESAPVNGHVVYLHDSSNFTFKRNLVRFNNRWKNGNVANFGDTTGGLIEENEIYSYHRNGIGGGNGNTFRRNYINSRERADLPGSPAGSLSVSAESRGDSGIIIYPGSNHIVENNISEGNERGIDINASGTTVNNRVYGHVSLNDTYGVLLTARGSGSAKMPLDNLFFNLVSYGYVHWGLGSRSARGTRCTNCSFIGTAGRNSTNGVIADCPSSYPGDGNYSFLGFGLLVTGTHDGSGISINSCTDSWTIDGVNSDGASPDYSPSSSANYSNKVDNTSPGMGTNIVCRPNGSQAKTTGVGADVLYTYTDGVLGSSKLWSTSKPDVAFSASTTGRYFLGCGAKVTGVNDTVGESCYDVTDRLNVTTAILNACVGGTY